MGALRMACVPSTEVREKLKQQKKGSTPDVSESLSPNAYTLSAEPEVYHMHKSSSAAMHGLAMQLA
jgi:hypothetical protein